MRTEKPPQTMIIVESAASTPIGQRFIRHLSTNARPTSTSFIVPTTLTCSAPNVERSHTQSKTVYLRARRREHRSGEARGRERGVGRGSRVVVVPLPFLFTAPHGARRDDSLLCSFHRSSAKGVHPEWARERENHHDDEIAARAAPTTTHMRSTRNELRLPIG